MNKGTRSTNQVCFFSNLGLHYDFFFKLRYNSHTIKLTNLKCATLHGKLIGKQWKQ